MNISGGNDLQLGDSLYFPEVFSSFSPSKNQGTLYRGHEYLERAPWNKDPCLCSLSAGPPIQIQNPLSCFPLKTNSISDETCRVHKLTFSDWDWTVQQVNK